MIDVFQYNLEQGNKVRALGDLEKEIAYLQHKRDTAIMGKSSSGKPLSKGSAEQYISKYRKRKNIAILVYELLRIAPDNLTISPQAVAGLQDIANTVLKAV